MDYTKIPASVVDSFEAAHIDGQIARAARKVPQRLNRERAKEIRAKQAAYVRGTTLRGLGKRQKAILRYIMLNPGCWGRQIDDATNVAKGTDSWSHSVTYDAINRLIERGVVMGVREAFRVRLYIADAVSVEEIASLDDSQVDET